MQSVRVWGGAAKVAKSEIITKLRERCCFITVTSRKIERQLNKKTRRREVKENWVSLLTNVYVCVSLFVETLM